MLAAPAALWVAAWSLQSGAWTERGAARSVALVQANVPQDAKWNRGPPAGVEGALPQS